MDTKGHASTRDLYDATGVHLRSCPLGPHQALETIRNSQPTAARMWLSADQATIWMMFPGSDKRYGYLVHLRRNSVLRVRGRHRCLPVRLPLLPLVRCRRLERVHIVINGRERPLTLEDLEGANYLVWGGDDTHSLIFGTCKCEDCHGDTLAMEVGSRAASWGIRRRTTGTPEQQGVWALNGILHAYEEREHQDERARRLARLRTVAQ